MFLDEMKLGKFTLWIQKAYHKNKKEVKNEGQITISTLCHFLLICFGRNSNWVFHQEDHELIYLYLELIVQMIIYIG